MKTALYSAARGPILTIGMEAPMRTWIVAILCAFACTGGFAKEPLETEENADGDMFSNTLSDSCRVSSIAFLDDDTLHGVEIHCKPSIVSYRRWRYVIPGSKHWPTPAWSDVDLGDEVVCKTHREYTSNKQFYFTIRYLQQCVRVQPQVSVEVRPATSGQQEKPE